MKSMSEQCSAIRDEWPAFKCRRLPSGGALWNGRLRPMSQIYTVSISFGPPVPDPLEPHVHLTLYNGVPRRDMQRMFPVVRILQPELHFPQNNLLEGGLPHVYLNPNHIPSSPLCLFDPRRGEWTYDDLIAATTVPWTADWLCCYEGWLATGQWFGGGTHIDRSQNNGY